ncbi:MAG TPA: preprotein translocase subunit SecE [Acidimicrobiales bacterium]|jgi:preprotein translocase SecE subunit|nr:preprotein translocase subunit SecE [Acidimicrobiales bacterium]
MDGPGGRPSRPFASATVRRPGIVEFLHQCGREVRKMVWPDRRTLGHNATVIVLTVVVLVVALGTLELAVGTLAGGVVR